LVAGLIGAVGVDFAGEHKLFAVGGEKHASGFGGQGSDLARAGAICVHEPDLGGAAPVGDEGDAFAVRRPAGTVVEIAALANAPGPAAGEGHQIDVPRPAVVGEVDGLDGERHLAAIGGDLGVADARDSQQRLHVEGLGLAEQGYGCTDKKHPTGHIPDCTEAAAEGGRCVLAW
jgi:hypothetical protein